MKKLLLIDANSLIHRSFHALPPFTAADGRPVGGLYGVASILLKLWREEKPDYAAALFDRPEPTFRKKKVESYKAQRAEVVPDLVQQLIAAHELFPNFSIRTFDAPGFEADDLIATFVEKFYKKPDVQIQILTGDRDTLQLVDKNVEVKTFKKGVSDVLIYDEAGVKEKYGLTPQQMIEYKMLVGDPSDNIKGVAGIGPKTACDVLQKYGDIQTALKNLPPDSNIGQRLTAAQGELQSLRELIELKRDVPVDIKLEDLKVEDRAPQLKKYFEELGFKALITRMLNGSAEAEAKQSQKDKSAQGKIF